MNNKEVLARRYVERLKAIYAIKSEEAQPAIEDFIAGYDAAVVNNNFEDVDFLINQLQHAYELASANKEVYAAAVLRYTLAKLGLLDKEKK